MFLSSIHGFTYSVTNRLGQACSIVMLWLAPAADGQHTMTAGMCILITCCALFTQLASTQALRPHTIMPLEHGMLSKIGASSYCLATLLDMG